MSRLALFDLLKTIAIIMVVITHSGWDTAERNAYLFPYTISMAVPIFMLIYGYLSAYGYGEKSIQEMFEKKGIVKKMVRILCPFTIVFLIQFIGIEHNYDVGQLLDTYLRGGEKHGGYYTPIMIQLIFLSPFIYAVVRKKGGLGKIFLLNLFFELVRNSYYISGATYRLLAVRYIFLVACGMYIQLHADQLKKRLHYGKLMASMLLGAGYIYLVVYTDYEEVIIKNWENTSMMCAFWIVPIFLILLAYGSRIKDRSIYLIGRASFHIFLVQMVFIDNRVQFVERVTPGVDAMVNLLVTVPVGILFFYLSTPVEKKVNEILQRKLSQ